jgi:quercetin dioxygenase-like cupin family protein
MTQRWQVFQAASAARYDELPLTNVALFAEEDFSGCLLGLLPGQVLPRHRHAHEHEAFDVLAGQGSVWLDGERVSAGPGAVIFVPAGVEHGFENDGDQPWLIRATIHQRTYLRQALRRAVDKRRRRAK